MKIKSPQRPQTTWQAHTHQHLHNCNVHDQAKWHLLQHFVSAMFSFLFYERNVVNKCVPKTNLCKRGKHYCFSGNLFACWFVLMNKALIYHMMMLLLLILWANISLFLLLFLCFDCTRTKFLFDLPNFDLEILHGPHHSICSLIILEDLLQPFG